MLSDADLLAALPALWRFAKATRPGDAGELMQKTCERAVAQRAQFLAEHEGGNATAWLITMMRKLGLNMQIADTRQLTRHAPLNESAPASGLKVGPAQEHAVQAIETLNAMARMNQSDARILMLAGYGYTDTESAEIEGIPKDTAKTRLRRARLKLIEAMGC